MKAAQKIVKELGESLEVKAGLTPGEKQEGIKELQRKGKVVAMIGDGINDAPALALANVGMVFSNEEQTAASEAADIVFLGGDFSSVSEIINISSRTIKIAIQSIYWGIGMSIVGQVFGAFGLIPPFIGAVMQEGIDVIVIINALRASIYRE
jgi:P-type E1-E2 ATPase